MTAFLLHDSDLQNSEDISDSISVNRDFFITRKARDEFQFPDSFYTLRGNIIIPNYRAAQTLAEYINRKNQTTNQRQYPVRPALLNAMGILHEVFHLVLTIYREEVNPEVYSKCTDFLLSHIDKEHIEELLEKVGTAFPPLSVYRGAETLDKYLERSTDTLSNRHILIEEAILLHLQHHNPALLPMADLIEEKELFEDPLYKKTISLLDQFFETQPKFGPDNLSLLKVLFEPILRSPDSIIDQLLFIQQKWSALSPRLKFNFSLLQAIDFIKEEGKYFTFMNEAERQRSIRPDTDSPWFHGWGGEKESPPVPTYSSAEAEPERFSADMNWMPRLILMAKNAFVWLHQLSTAYGRQITYLNEIPDEELQRLASFGITGLWLIGIWKRSRASKTVKHILGNIDAEASAYSLLSYDINDDLGGYEAYRNLKERAARFGIRLACDMVPNHMGMDSDWVISHPEWFIQTSISPYPNYTFNGPDLSINDRVGIFLEDGYWRRTDAAVVFKRLDRFTGDVKYIYHGNDGTNMPWNDTAQLNFLNPEVREAVIQTILHVARMFPIIRFDAAMTLAKKHFQRLWYPQPGTGGAIPSRSMFALTKEQFDEQIPVEFWREVVDRIQQEVPDTLLLAEAFWLMEGYFVRTLGMHRVYNSAFMHMLKKEENANFKQTIKNVMEFNPQILKRHVNFMSNPDEDTAIAQFGNGDKYFGVCVLMVTLPGLPMLGHGQLEGFTEKYGMEYRRAYYQEYPDQNLLHRHQQDIVPLLKKRYLFAEVENFQLFDFYTGDGMTNDDVFAYSNRYGTERALIVYNNRYDRTQGWIAPTAAPQLIGGNFVQAQLGSALNLLYHHDSYYILKDQITKLEFLYRTREIHEKGIPVTLNGFQYHVFLEFTEVFASQEYPYDILYQRLNGRGVPSVEDELSLLRLEPLHHHIRELLNEGNLAILHKGKKNRHRSIKALRVLQENFQTLINVARTFDHAFSGDDDRLERLDQVYSALLELTAATAGAFKSPVPTGVKELVQRRIAPASELSHRGWQIAICWMCIDHITRLRRQSSDLVNEWKLERVLIQAFAHLDASHSRSVRDFDLVKLLVRHSSVGDTQSLAQKLLSLLDLPLTEQFIGINQWQDVIWFSKEQFEELLDWLIIIDLIQVLSGENQKTTIKERISSILSEGSLLRKQAEESGYKFEEFLSGLNRVYLRK